MTVVDEPDAIHLAHRSSALVALPHKWVRSAPAVSKLWVFVAPCCALLRRFDVVPAPASRGGVEVPEAGQSVFTFETYLGLFCTAASKLLRFVAPCCASGA
jgi:hypothetical protein